MSETFKHRIERLEHEPTLPSPEHHKELPEHAAENLQKAEQARTETLVDAREKVAELAENEHKNLTQEHLNRNEQAPVHHAAAINSELKSITLNRELKNIRRKLNAPERALSKAIHKPAIRVTSEVVGRTVSRPSGLLGGGIMAFLGTSAYLFLTKYIGLTYNYSVFLILFVLGFALGVALELVIHVSASKNRS